MSLTRNESHLPWCKKYNDIHNGGEATEREENLLMKYSEQLERLESVLSSIDEILKLDRYE